MPSPTVRASSAAASRAASPPVSPAARSSAAAVETARVRRARARRRRRRMVAWWLVAVVVAGAGSFLGGLLAAPVDFTVPPPPRSAVLLDAHGRVFATVRSPQVRAPVAAGQIPQVMRQAIVAAEDEHFYSHQGIDPSALLRAAWRDLTGAPLQGGSTITQQYVKNVYVGDKRTPLRKLREAALAFRLEHHLSKDEILTDYLNSLYLGNGTYGVQAASTFYFGVGIHDLDLDPATGQRSPALGLARAAMLAGSAPAPSAWNPLADRSEARRRQLYTLNRMVANRMISSQQASAAYGIQLAISPHRAPDVPTIAPEFRDDVEADLRQRFGRAEVEQGGLRVTTTLDLDLQAAAVQAVQEVLPSPSEPEAAVVAVDPRTGDVEAMTEKRDGGYSRGGFDIATDAVRQSGSTIKPFTLAVALQEGHSMNEVRYGPHCIQITPTYAPCNAGDSEAGSFTLRQALAHSVNTIYEPLAVQVGVPRVLRLAYDAGMRPASQLLENPVPSKGLGVGVTPLSEALAYATLSDHGVAHPARRLLAVHSDRSGQLMRPAGAPAGRRVLPAPIADQVVDAMRDVVHGGTYEGDPLPFDFWGKTGTTDDEKDAWFTGCTAQLCIAVWMGYDNPRPMENVAGVAHVYGGTLPARIFARTWEIYRQRLTTPTASPAPAPTGGTAPAQPVPPVREQPVVPSAPAPRVSVTAVAPTTAPTSRAPAPPAPSPTRSRPPPLLFPPGGPSG